MAPRGPKPRPTALRKLTAPAVRKQKNAPKLSTGRSKGKRPPPSTVPDEAQPVVLPIVKGVPDSCASSPVAAATYKKLVKDLTKMKVIGGNDLTSVEALALAYARALEAEALVTTMGVMIRDAFGYKANPAVAMARAQWQEVRRWCVEFGLTPSSRTRVSQIAEDDEHRNGKDEGEEPGAPKGKQSIDDFLFGQRGRVIGAIGA